MDCHCIHHFGQPLAHQTRPALVPTGSEVIVQITAAGVCHTDLHLREGGLDLGRGQRLNYGDRGIRLPLTPGHEIVGRVVAAGPDAGDFDPAAQWVVFPWSGCGSCAICATGKEQLCANQRFLGIHSDGGYATQVRVAHPRYLFPIGDLDPAHAAQLACSGLTAFAALDKVAASAHAGAIVVIGAGGLGLMCVELMQALGMQAPVVADIAPDKRAAARAAGARAVVDSGAADALAAIQSACGGAPAAVIDFVGAEATARLGFDVLAKGGTLVTVGLFGGAAPWSLPLITLKSVSIVGSYVGSLTDFAALMALARRGGLRPIPSTPYPLSQADAVMNRLEAGEILGRAVLVPD